jgi:hypothetical protein
MYLKTSYHYFCIALFTSFFFFWGVDLYQIQFLSYLVPEFVNDYLSSFRLSYLIIFLIIPIFYGLVKKKILSLNEIFNHQKYIIYLIFFIIVHYFLVKIYYQEIFAKSEIANLIYLFLLAIVYCHYRNIIIINFEKIITLYLIIFIAYSIFEGSQIYKFGFLTDSGEIVFKNTGQCNGDLFLIEMLRKYLSISLSNSIYLENSHLAMMTVAVTFISVFILTQDKKINILFLLLSLASVTILLNNLSTTFFVCYFLSQITLILFFLKKINIKFWAITIMLLLMNSYLFLSDKNCVVKVTDFEGKEVLKNNLNKNINKVSKNLTTLIYERSFILTINTFKHRLFGWGFEGTDNATHSLFNQYDNLSESKNDNSASVTLTDELQKSDIFSYRIEKNKEDHFGIILKIRTLNVRDALSNFFKMFNEFGIFTFFIFFYFIKYMVNIKNISSYNLFIIILFITLCIRGAGYFNGAFIFCVLEFFYYKKSIQSLKTK